LSSARQAAMLFVVLCFWIGFFSVVAIMTQSWVNEPDVNRSSSKPILHVTELGSSVDRTETQYADGELHERTEPRIGDTVSDGSVYAGISPTDNRAMFVMRHDAQKIYNWRDALSLACAHEYLGYRDWIVPDQYELDLLFQKRAEIKDFANGWYWSATPYDREYAIGQLFSFGTQTVSAKSTMNRVRCIRKD
jgi:hypothetical protein